MDYVGERIDMLINTLLQSDARTYIDYVRLFKCDILQMVRLATIVSLDFVMVAGYAASTGIPMQEILK